MLSLTYHPIFLSGSPFSKVWHRLSHYQMTKILLLWLPESPLVLPESPLVLAEPSLVLDKSWIHISE